MVHARYWLNFCVKLDVGKSRYITEYAAISVMHQPEALLWNAKVHMYRRKYGWGERADTWPRMLATNSPFNMPDINTDQSLPGFSSLYRTPRSWSEVSEETPCARAKWTQLPCIHHTGFVVAEQPWPESSWLQNLGYVRRQCRMWMIWGSRRQQNICFSCHAVGGRQC